MSNGLIKAMARKIDQEITGVTSEVEVEADTVIVVEQPVTVLDCNNHTLNGLGLDMFWFDEWEEEMDGGEE